MRPEYRLAPLFLAMAFSGCVLKEEQQTCTMEQRMNFCVANNGKFELPPQYKYVQERTYRGTTHRDTLSDVGGSGGACFSEGFGRARVLAMSGDTVKAQTEWVDIQDDGCHAEAAIVHLSL